jgi:UDP-N-acetylglucosamine:LPS N-acetylglucosamine transferase
VEGGNAMKQKICLAASLGGHLEEIARLVELGNQYDVFLLTEKGGFVTLSFCNKVYYLNHINRKELLFLPKFISIFIKSFYILFKEKPSSIISTGALATYPACLLGKLMGIQIIYIESFARVNSASLTGRLLYRFADLFIVQWEEMLEIFPKAVYGGGIF